MKEIENIFSQSKKQIKKNITPNPTIKIIIDTREKQSLIASNLFNQKANIDFEKLEIGDYLIENLIIERKTYSDFINSMIDKRLQEQLINLKKYENYLLIIESSNKKINSKINKNAVSGMILSIIYDFKIPIIFTENEKETADYLILLAKKLEKNKSKDIQIRQSKTFKTKEEQKQFILEGFPGIGPSISKKLIEKFESLNKIFNSSEEELKEIDKFDENKVKKFKDLLN